PYIYVITFDYSKAFDPLSHVSVASKLAHLDIPDCIHNWILDFLLGRLHSTRLNNKPTSSATITASVVQGSVLGPSLFNLNSTELCPVSHLNAYFKYADDGYLIVPS